MNEDRSDGFDSLRAAGVSEARIAAMKATAAEQWLWLKNGIVVGQSGRWRAEAWMNEGRDRGRHDLMRSIAPVNQPGVKKEKSDGKS